VYDDTTAADFFLLRPPHTCPAGLGRDVILAIGLRSRPHTLLHRLRYHACCYGSLRLLPYSSNGADPCAPRASVQCGSLSGQHPPARHPCTTVPEKPLQRCYIQGSYGLPWTAAPSLESGRETHRSLSNPRPLPHDPRLRTDDHLLRSNQLEADPRRHRRRTIRLHPLERSGQQETAVRLRGQSVAARVLHRTK
jgi:hypothetical protein